MRREIFDAHFHIIDQRFPLTANQGYLPTPFTTNDYLEKLHHYGIHAVGGAVVSGSFQAFDQSYLLDALETLGPHFVGVVNLSSDTSDSDILRLNKKGARAVRFNLFRGGSENIKHLKKMADRIYELVEWHVELYLDSKDLKDLSETILSLPKVSIDHLGISKVGFNQLCFLVEKGVSVKASGFMRVGFDVLTALQRLHQINSAALMFGTDLPGTRAPREFQLSDVQLIENNFSENDIKKILIENARSFYNIS